MTTEFDEDTALVRDGEGDGDSGTWRGAVSPRWNIGVGANGGYMASFPLRAMAELAPFPDPLTMTTHYLRRPAWAPLTVRAHVTHATRAHAYLQATVEQDEGPIATAMAVFGILRDHNPGDDMVVGAPPDLPRPDEVPTMPAPQEEGMEFVRRFEYKVTPDHLEAFWGPEPAPARSVGWFRLPDRPLDALAVPLFMDGFPPAVFGSHGPGLAPTIELTVHWRSQPTTTWHAAEFRTRFLIGGYMEEDGELWGEDGRLVAQSRQLARFTPAPPG
ncbi:MAG TPA: thioesterase family protein [Acidimicrobiales bacterium]|jgi:hypothetical protein